MQPSAPIPEPARGRGRRPAAEVRADALAAVGRILAEEGSSELTFERVARESGVSKTTLYKWWKTPGTLALDGYFQAVEEALAFPDTGDVRRDLTAQLTAFAHVMTATTGGRVLLELIGQSQADAELAAAYRERYSAARRALAVNRLEIARTAGQLSPRADAQAIVDQLWGAIYHRLLIPDEPVTEEFVRALIANLFDGVGGARSPQRRP